MEAVGNPKTKTKNPHEGKRATGMENVNKARTNTPRCSIRGSLQSRMGPNRTFAYGSA